MLLIARDSMLYRVSCCALALAIALPHELARADQGDPVALRIWPEGVVSLETFWNFSIVISAHDAPIPAELAEADLKITRFANQPEKLRCELRSVAASEAKLTPLGTAPAGSSPPSTSVSEWTLADISLYLDRLENQATQTLLDSNEATFVSKNGVSLSHIGRKQILIAVDGLRIGIPLAADFAEETDAIMPLDALVLSPLLSGSGPLKLDQLQLVVQRWQPRYAIVDRSMGQLSAAAPWEEAVGNTVALAYRPSDDDLATSQPAPAAATRWVQLDTQQWQMPAELAELFERKEAASRHTQQVFADLSVEQLNFKPSNGTHTPRWNSEHMMGRELLFFSQIFAQRTSEIAVIDLNPQQMPADYQARHVDWDGGEEARQLERVSAFTRRFAYLLSGLDLEQPAPGSSWTLRRLLKQMDLHYSEHTANVQKKFALPDWPRREP